MAGLTGNFLFYPLLRQPIFRAEREERHHKLFASVVVVPSELDISSFGLIIILYLVKSKGHRPTLALKGTSGSPAERPRPRNHEGEVKADALFRDRSLTQYEFVPIFCVNRPLPSAVSSRCVSESTRSLYVRKQ